MIKIFKRGLITLAPLAITLAVIFWLFGIFENIFRAPIQEIIGPENYFPGLSIILSITLIFIVGIFINTWLLRKFSEWGEKIIARIPLVKSLYGAVQDVLNYLQTKEKDFGHRVVRVEINGMAVLGFLTRNDFSDLPEGVGEKGEVVVYIPMSYQIGGYTVIVPKEKVQHIDMSVQAAMRLMMIAIAQKSSSKKEEKPKNRKNSV
ncbi:MAG: DUF502 domain-containing protein [Simkaniaceae bacterium]